tara:strand:- start:86112 stop:86285 length:174 start_codon:yes stop_codon:yes gene_type:complete
MKTMGILYRRIFVFLSPQNERWHLNLGNQRTILVEPRLDPLGEGFALAIECPGMATI